MLAWVLRAAVAVSILTVTANGDADPRAWTPAMPQGAAGAPRAGDSSQLRDVRVQLNRAMGQLQSNAQQPSAKEAARDLNCWLMHVLSQPHVDDNSSERRALLTNLKRISQLQKDNLRLRLQHIVQCPAGMGPRSVCEGNCEECEDREDHEDREEREERELQLETRQEPLQAQLFGDLQRWKVTIEKSAPTQAPAPATRSQEQRAVREWQTTPPQHSGVLQPAETRPMLRPRALIGGRSAAPLDEYAFHRRGQNLPSRATGPLGTTPQAGIRRGDEGGVGSAGAVAEEGSESLRGGGLDDAMRQVHELRELNRQLSRQVSDLANDNIRLKSVLNQAQSSVIEAAVAQLSSRTVATERAVPSIVKAASTWHARNLLGDVGVGGVGGLGAGGVGMEEWEGMLEDGIDPSERGRVMASVALLKRLGLRVGQYVKLRRTLSRDRLGSSVNSTAGEFLGVLVGEGETGTDDATVYLHMDDGQVRQFALSDVDTVCASRGITPAREGAPVGLRADLALAAARAAQERGAAGVCLSPGSGSTDGGTPPARHDRRAGLPSAGRTGTQAGRGKVGGNLLLRESRKMMSQELKS